MLLKAAEYIAKNKHIEVGDEMVKKVVSDILIKLLGWLSGAILAVFILKYFAKWPNDMIKQFVITILIFTVISEYGIVPLMEFLKRKLE